MRVVPLGIAYRQAWRANSWDQTVIPRPFTQLRVVGAPVISVPQGLGKAGMEHYRQRIEQSMFTATDLAEAWVHGHIDRPSWPEERRTVSSAAA